MKGNFRTRTTTAFGPPALCHQGRSDYQPLSIAPILMGWWSTPQTITKKNACRYYEEITAKYAAKPLRRSEIKEEPKRAILRTARQVIDLAGLGATRTRRHQHRGAQSPGLCAARRRIHAGARHIESRSAATPLPCNASSYKTRGG
jgi:hypothetical protein